jgi:hypothetical protein
VTFPPLTRVGWTSARAGLTPTQEMVARIVLVDLRSRRGAVELHHGWCLGGDDEGADMAQLLGYRIVAHPGHPKGRPNDLSMRGHFTDNDEIREPGEFLARDRDIVNDTGVTLAFPPSETDPGRGGTWYTARYAIKVGKPRLVITPSGRVYDSHGVEQIWTPVEGEESA